MIQIKSSLLSYFIFWVWTVVICNSKDDFASKRGQPFIQTFFFLRATISPAEVSLLQNRNWVRVKKSSPPQSVRWQMDHPPSAGARQQTPDLLLFIWAVTNTVTNTADKERDPPMVLEPIVQRKLQFLLFSFFPRVSPRSSSSTLAAPT